MSMTKYDIDKPECVWPDKLRFDLSDTVKTSEALGKNLRPFMLPSVILAPQGMTSHHKGWNEGIQSFEIPDWRPIPTFMRTGFTTAGMTETPEGGIRLCFKKIV